MRSIWELGLRLHAFISNLTKFMYPGFSHVKLFKWTWPSPPPALTGRDSLKSTGHPDCSLAQMPIFPHLQNAAMTPLADLLSEVRACRHCEAELPLGPRPVLSVSESARILVIGQAPGARVHATGIPWNDPSGDRLRAWMGVSRETFYDVSRIAIMPMGFCYPGKGKSGDLPPRRECAGLWHEKILHRLPNIRLTLLVGGYAQRHYLDGRRGSLTATVAVWKEYLPDYFPLVHPSPRNTFWLRQNPWFEELLLPQLRAHVKRYMQHH